MKAQPVKFIYAVGYEPCTVEEATHVRLHFPGPVFAQRTIPVILRGSRKDTGCWSWNGDCEKPTLKPSIRTTDSEAICHSYVNDGRVEYLLDSTHELAGQTLDMLDVIPLENETEVDN